MNIFSNPIIRKNIMSQMRRDRIIGISFGYIGFIALIFLLNFLFYYTENNFLLELSVIYKNIYVFLLILQFCLYFVFGFNTSGLAIVKEKEQRTYEFFKTLPMSYRDIIIGEMVGSTITIHYLQLITVPITLITGLMAGIAILITAKLYILLLFGAFFLNSLGLLVSSMIDKQTSLNLVIFCTVGLIIGAPCIGMEIYHDYPANFVSLLSPIPLFLQYLSPYHSYKMNAYISFFNIKIPSLVYTCFIYTCLGMTFLTGIFRKLRDETVAPFSREKLPFLFLIFELILIGFMRDVFRITDISSISLFSVFFQISWFVLVILSLMLTPNYASIFVWLNSKKRRIYNSPGSPIFITSIICFFIMIIVGLSIFTYLPFPFTFTMDIIVKLTLGLGMLLLYLLAYLLLAQFGVLISKEKGLTFGVGFVMILYILPFLMSAFSQMDFFMLFNPTSGSYFSGAFVSNQAFHENWLYSLLIPFILTIGFALLLWSRLKTLRASR